MPNVSNNGCGKFGGYTGEAGGYWTVNDCSATNQYNYTAAPDAYTNINSYGDGIGVGEYWFGGGPGMDPNYNGTTSEASAWGKKQAEAAVTAAQSHPDFDTDIIFLDVEDDYPTTAPSGWDEVVAPNSGCADVTSSGISSSLDMATVTGFLNYIFGSTSYWDGIYSSPGEWSKIMGSDSVPSDTMEWTASYGGNCVQPGPSDWTQGSGSCSSHSAGWFGNLASGSTCGVEWQWAGVGSGDYDQIDQNYLYDCH